MADRRRAAHADEAFLLGDVLEQEVLHLLVRAGGVDRGDPLREVADVVIVLLHPFAEQAAVRASRRSRPRSTDAPPNDAARSLPREPDGMHFWPSRASFWRWTTKLYTIWRHIGQIRSRDRGEIVYKSHEIRGLFPGRRLPGQKNARFSRRNPCRSAPKASSPSPAISYAADGRWLERLCRARQGGRRARAAQCLPPPEHAGRGHAVGQLRELPLPLPWLDLRSAGPVPERAAAGRAQGSAVVRPAPGVAAVGRRFEASSSSALDRCDRRPLDVGALPAYGGTLVTDIACNWKVCVEHLLARAHAVARLHLGLAVAGGASRRCGDDHGAGRAAHLPAHAAVHATCSAPTSRTTGRRPPPSSMSARRCRPIAPPESRRSRARWWMHFHRRLAEAYAQDLRRPELSVARVRGSRIFASHEVPSWKRATLLHGERGSAAHIDVTSSGVTS